MPDEIVVPSAVDLMGDDNNNNSPSGDPGSVTPPTPPAFDPSVLGKEIGSQVAEALKSHRTVSEQPDPKPLTAEEAKKLLQLWDPDEPFIQRFSNLETQKQAFLEMRDGLTRQMYAIMNLHGNELKAALQSEYAPAVEYVRTKDVADREERFFKANEDFREPALRPVIEAVTQHLAKEGKLGKDEKANFDLIASGVEATIKLHNPTFTRGVGVKAHSRSNPSSSNGLAVTTPGGGGGGGNQGGKPDNRSKAVALLS